MTRRGVMSAAAYCALSVSVSLLNAHVVTFLPSVTPLLAAQAACIGAMFFSYFNDSYFWVVNRMLGVKSTKHQMLVLTLPVSEATKPRQIAITGS